MQLKHLYLRNFRNYEEATISFQPGVNLVLGRNAQGKTNLLEAIYLLGSGRSFRTLHMKELIREGAPYFFIRAQFVKEGIEQEAALLFDGIKKQLRYNNTHYSSFAPLLGFLPSVLYLPSDSDLISSAPQLRRRFLDIALASADPLYMHHLTRYMNALKQRNALLKDKKEETLGVWEQIMVSSAEYITAKRKDAIQELTPLLQAMAQKLSCGEDHAAITYIPSPCSEEIFLKGRRRELYLGCTLAGPHRDDLLFAINDKEAKSFASEGQKRSFIASLRLAEWLRLQTHLGHPPFMSIDDYAIHLDSHREQTLRTALSSLGQVFLTAPSAPAFANYHAFAVEQGKIV